MLEADLASQLTVMVFIRDMFDSIVCIYISKYKQHVTHLVEWLLQLTFAAA